MRLDSIFQDVRYAVRTIGRAPLFAATVAATMGLALGLVGSAFTLLNAYLIRPVNLPNPRALHALSWDTETTFYERFGLADYAALEPEARRVADVAATLDVSVMQDAASTRGLLVTGNYFEMLGARPAVGRLLRRDDAARGTRPVVALARTVAVAVRVRSGDRRPTHRAWTSALRSRRRNGTTRATDAPGARELLGTADHGGRVSKCGRMVRQMRGRSAL